jgi:hypothetical protein
MTMHADNAKRAGSRALGMVAALTIAAASVGAAAWADTNSVSTAKVTVPANALSVGEIESRLTAQGFKVKEIEVRDLLAEVEGYDAEGREVELVIDRRSGETLVHEYDR